MLKGLYEAQWEARERRELFTAAGDCLLHVKLCPARHCLWCLSFNRLVDKMNELDTPSATGERSPALSELRSTLEPLGQSGPGVPAAACRPRGRRKSRKLLFCSDFNEVGPVTAGRDQKSDGCRRHRGCPERGLQCRGSQDALGPEPLQGEHGRRSSCPAGLRQLGEVLPHRQPAPSADPAPAAARRAEGLSPEAGGRGTPEERLGLGLWALPVPGSQERLGRASSATTLSR